jgi:hypothetical protein
VPGSLALILADRMPWSSVFLITALFMLPGLAMTLMVREPAATAVAPKTLREAVVEPFREFVERSGLGAGAARDRVHLPLQARRQHGDRARDAVLPRHGVHHDRDRHRREERRPVGQRRRRHAGRPLDGAHRHQQGPVAVRVGAAGVDPRLRLARVDGPAPTSSCSPP